MLIITKCIAKLMKENTTQLLSYKKFRSKSKASNESVEENLIENLILHGDKGPQYKSNILK
ncbi:MAG: hypothetical protein ACRCX8_12350 [Sarcina sp.]